MKWEKIQKETLNNMFRDISLDEAKTDDECKLYLDMMPNKANEMLLRVCTNYIKLPKQYELKLENNNMQYNLKNIINDFYEFVDIETNNKKLSTDKYTCENGILRIFGNDVEDKLTIKYNAYPTKITSETANDFELDVPEEVAILIPLYIASELYKDDDMQQAVFFRNQFEVSLAELRQPNIRKEFISTKGWL